MLPEAPVQTSSEHPLYFTSLVALGPAHAHTLTRRDTPSHRQSQRHTQSNTLTPVPRPGSVFPLPTPVDPGHCHSRRAGRQEHSCPGGAQLVAKHRLPRIKNVPCFYAACAFSVSLCLWESSFLDISSLSAGLKVGRTGMCCSGLEQGRGPCALWQAGWGVGAITSSWPSTPGLAYQLLRLGGCNGAGVSPTRPHWDVGWEPGPLWVRVGSDADTGSP